MVGVEVLEGFEFGGNAVKGVGLGEVEVGLVVDCVCGGMSSGVDGCLFGEGFEVVKGVGLGIEFDEAVLVDTHGFGDFDVCGKHAFVLIFVKNGESADPGGALAWHACGFFGEVCFGIDEVVEVDGHVGIEIRIGGDDGGGAWDVEVAEGIFGSVGIAPEPVEFVLEDGGDDGVRTEDAAVEDRVLCGHVEACDERIAVDAGAGESVESLSGVGAFDFDDGGGARCGGKGFTLIAEAVGFEGVAVRFDGEEDAG